MHRTKSLQELFPLPPSPSFYRHETRWFRCLQCWCRRRRCGGVSRNRNFLSFSLSILFRFTIDPRFQQQQPGTRKSDPPSFFRRTTGNLFLFSSLALDRIHTVDRWPIDDDDDGRWDVGGVGGGGGGYLRINQPAVINQSIELIHFFLAPLDRD